MVWPMTNVDASVPTTAKSKMVSRLPKKCRFESEKPASKMMGGSSMYRKSSSSKVMKDACISISLSRTRASRKKAPMIAPMMMAPEDAGK